MQINTCCYTPHVFFSFVSFSFFSFQISVAHADTCFSCIVKNRTKTFFRKRSPTPAELSMSWIGHVFRGLCQVHILKEKLNFLLSPSLPNRQFNHAFSFQIIFQKTTKIVSFSLFVPAWSTRFGSVKRGPYCEPWCHRKAAGTFPFSSCARERRGKRERLGTRLVLCLFLGFLRPHNLWPDPYLF